MSLALGLIFSLVAAAFFLAVVRGWGGGLGRMLLGSKGSLAPSQSAKGWLETPSMGGGGNRFCCLRAGFARCPKAAGGCSSAGEVSQQL